jgi:hypothetical protein
MLITMQVPPHERGETAMQCSLMDVEDFGDEFTPNPEVAKVKYR